MNVRVLKVRAKKHEDHRSHRALSSARQATGKHNTATFGFQNRMDISIFVL